MNTQTKQNEWYELLGMVSNEKGNAIKIETNKFHICRSMDVYRIVWAHATTHIGTTALRHINIYEFWLFSNELRGLFLSFCFFFCVLFVISRLHALTTSHSHSPFPSTNETECTRRFYFHLLLSTRTHTHTHTEAKGEKNNFLVFKRQNQMKRLTSYIRELTQNRTDNFTERDLNSLSHSAMVLMWNWVNFRIFLLYDESVGCTVTVQRAQNTKHTHLPKKLNNKLNVLFDSLFHSTAL